MPIKAGTLDSYGATGPCEYSGIPVAIRQTLTNNGVTFALNPSGSNNSPELVITGEGTYTYPEIRVVTTDSGNQFVGHAQPGGTSVPAGKVSRAYDISTPGKTLQGVIICLGMR